LKRVICFGGGVQTTALVILVAQGKEEVDEVVFADTGAEKPETYWYMENYTLPLLGEAGIPFTSVRSEAHREESGLYNFLWQIKDVPSIRQRLCTDHFKIRPIKKYLGKEVGRLIGFSIDEAYRAKRGRWTNEHYPLIEKQMTVGDCRLLIQEYGFPVPLKSSCYFCPFQHPIEWNWLKNNHPDLFQKALDLEANYHRRKPEMKEWYGLLRGTPLWKMQDGLQPEMFTLTDGSCWSGHCGH